MASSRPPHNDTDTDAAAGGPADEPPTETTPVAQAARSVAARSQSDADRPAPAASGAIGATGAAESSGGGSGGDSGTQGAPAREPVIGRISLPEMGTTASEAVTRGAGAFQRASRMGGPAMILAAGLALIIASIAVDDSALAWPGVPLTLIGGLASRLPGHR